MREGKVQHIQHKGKLETVFLAGRQLLKNFKFILQFVFTVPYLIKNIWHLVKRNRKNF